MVYLVKEAAPFGGSHSNPSGNKISGERTKEPLNEQNNHEH